MLLSINTSVQIAQLLSKDKKAGKILDFYLILQLNNQVEAWLFVKQEGVNWHEQWKAHGIETAEQVSIEEITEEMRDYDPAYKRIWEFLEKLPADDIEKRINFGYRRRFGNLLEDHSKREDNITCPIITFYSYKGGMGRTTTLATYAAYYARKGKRVVMIDCDFEAPGFSNFFEVDKELLDQKNGIVEYILDGQYLGDKPAALNPYYIEISREYSGDGQIFMFPAGNLASEQLDGNGVFSPRYQYLEGLSRLDFSSTKRMVELFETALKNIYDELKPDVILIDSRTGFNDIFGTMAFHFASTIVGFFGSSEQHIPGIHFFLDTVSKIQGKNIFMANSILPEVLSDDLYDAFREIIQKYIDENSEKYSSIPSLFRIEERPILRTLGVSGKSLQKYKSLISDTGSLREPPYSELFLAIDEALNPLVVVSETNEVIELSDNGETIEPWQPVIEEVTPTMSANRMSSIVTRPVYGNLLGLKQQLLQRLSNDFPMSYGEEYANKVFDETFLRTKFYFRDCMKDIFVHDKILIKGGKGTGKTFFYKALQQSNFLKYLKKFANLNGASICATHVISIQKQRNPDRVVDMSIFEQPINMDKEEYYRRLWVAFTWNAIALDLRDTPDFFFTSDLQAGAITKDATIETKQKFHEIVCNDSLFAKIESDLKELNRQLTREKTQLLVLYDQLDHAVKPIYWAERLSPLIKFWRSNPYSNIQPKLFVRTDLLNKIGEGQTNAQILRSQSISIEWSQDEIFAYLFKIIFSAGAVPESKIPGAKSEFMNLMYNYRDVDKALIEEIGAITKDNYQQVPLDRKYIEPLVETFFGRYADTQGTNRFGTSYDWFHNNLCNANGTISIRPFLELVKKALEYAANDIEPKPIVSPRYYAHPDNRKVCVEGYIDDLADENGNQGMKYLFDYIKYRSSSREKIPLSMPQEYFLTMLNETIRHFSATAEEKNWPQNERNLDYMKKMLINNGIVEERHRAGGYTNYRFAYLYKYYLELKGN